MQFRYCHPNGFYWHPPLILRYDFLRLYCSKKACVVRSTSQQILEYNPYALDIALLQATTKFVSVESSSKIIYKGDPSWLVSEICSHDCSLSAWGHVIYLESQNNVGSMYTLDCPTRCAFS